MRILGTSKLRVLPKADTDHVHGGLVGDRRVINAHLVSMRRLRHLLLHPLLPTALSCPPRADPYLMPLAQLRCHRLVRPLLRNRPRFLTQTIFIRHAVLRLIFPLFSRCALCAMLQRGTRPIRRNQTLHIEDVPRTSRTGQLARLAGSALRGPGRREHLCGVEVLARKSHLLL